MPERTSQPKKRRRARRHGFMVRAKRGKRVLRRRRAKGRARLTASRKA